MFKKKWIKRGDKTLELPGRQMETGASSWAVTASYGEPEESTGADALKSRTRVSTSVLKIDFSPK